MKVTRSIHCLTLAVGLCLVATAHAAPPPAVSSAPHAVSPGLSDRMAAVELRCPTFSWSLVPGAASYELVVWEVGAGGEVAGEGGRPALSEPLPGSVTSWTPSLDRCLAPGGRYAWVVRAAGEKTVSAWSEARLFAVASGPSRGELDEAVRAYLAAGGEEETFAGGSVTESGVAAEPSAAVVSEPVVNAASLASAVAAISGEMAETTGETVGIRGISRSPDGAGAVFANTAGGADLVLDGSAQSTGDTILTESGIEVGQAAFEIRNRSKDLRLTLNGTGVVALECKTGELAKSSSGAWTCGTDADALGGLSCSHRQIASYDGDAGWLCDNDANTTYLAGNQLALAGTTFNVVEGAESGLNADLLDGFEGAAFAQQATTYTKTEVDALLTVDNIQAPIPVAPTNLRVTPNPSFPGMRRLWWSMDSLAGASSFVVYQADLPITDGNKTTARRRVATSLYSPVEIFPGSGVQYFRVEAVNVLGDAGPLSTELAIDTTSRLAYRADQRAEDLVELFTVPATGGGTTRVSDDLISFGDVSDLAWSPDGSRLVYLADQDTDDVFELYVVPATGGGATKVNDTFADDLRVVSRFAWSPDGSRLAYLADQDTLNLFELYVVPATGGGATKVNDTFSDSHRDVRIFAWSPDGSRLAYLADQETWGVSELYVVPATGGGATKVNDALVESGNVLSFAWSPDGSRLAYLADQGTDGVLELYVVPASGGGATKVNDTFADDRRAVSTFAWSPDSSRLVYRADQDTDGVSELYVVPALGGGATKVSDTLVAGGIVQQNFAWSPDGSRLAYRADQDTDNVFELYVVPATGGGAIKVSDTLVANGNVGFIAWSPDGSRLVYLADQDTVGVYELYVVPATGGGATKVSDNGGVLSAAWSPDGSRLAYRADQDTDNVFELYVVPATGGAATKVNDALAGRGVTGFAWSPLGVE